MVGLHILYAKNKKKKRFVVFFYCLLSERIRIAANDKHKIEEYCGMYGVLTFFGGFSGSDWIWARIKCVWWICLFVEICIFIHANRKCHKYQFRFGLKELKVFLLRTPQTYIRSNSCEKNNFANHAKYLIIKRKTLNAHRYIYWWIYPDIDKRIL